MARAERGRTQSGGPEQARIRLRTARAYLEVADLVIEEQGRSEMPGVAAGLAVLAGIAGSDAICAIRLGEIHRGDDHRGASALLAGAVPDGKRLAATFSRLIDLKDEAHYGLSVLAPKRAKDALRWARQIVDRAGEEVER
jgi:hypothetical protein